MDRVQFLNNYVKNNENNLLNSSLLYSLILALKPKDACRFFEFNFSQPYKIRNYTLQKIASDISIKYFDFHKEFVRKLLELLENSEFRKKDSCAFAVDSLYNNLSDNEQDFILRIFLSSKYINLRRRAYKRLRYNWRPEFEEIITKNLTKYRDLECLNIIIENYSREFLLEEYSELIKYLDQYLLSKFYIKLSPLSMFQLKDLKRINKISYLYVIVKLKLKISQKESLEILIENKKHEKIGLILWCIGKLGHWNNLVRFINKNGETSIN